MMRRPLDDDYDRDPAHAEILAALENPQDGPQRPSGGPADLQGPLAAANGSQRRRRATARRPGPDSNMGLAYAFNDRCPEPSWAHGMQLNSLKGLAAMFREMREHGLDADRIRALIDLYFQQLGGKVPDRPYWLDFKGRRWRLLKGLEDSGSLRTGADYDGWRAGAPPAPGGDFAAGWRRP